MTRSTLTSNPETFPSLASLRIVHSELLKQYRQNNDLTPELLTEVQTFLLRGRATGALLDIEDERWSAQSLLDYWTSILHRKGEEPPDVTLVEFDASLAPELPDSLCPYLGLEAFHEENHNLFFGRQRLLNKLLKHLENYHFLAVIGSSGSGKSSIVLGGLIPSLKAGRLPDSETWHYYWPMVPGSHPLNNLARVLCPHQQDRKTWIAQQIEKFQADQNHLLKLLNENTHQPGVLVIDQFEETFTLCLNDQTRQAFIDNLLTVIQSSKSRHVVIVTLRTDFESRVALYSNLQQAFEQGQVRVTPMDAKELRQAIERPAESVGLKFEEGLVDQLLEDVLGEPAALPLLQFTLLKLWENRERNRVTWETYKRLGGGRLALSRSADELYNQLIPEDQVTFKRILLKMVKPTEGLEVTSNRIPCQCLYQAGEAQDRIDRVLEKLVQARLVRLTEGEQSADAQVEVAHEALVRNWPRLVEWLEDERVNLRNRWRLKSAVEQWQERDYDRSVLWRGALLEDARRYEDLSPLEQEFVELSLNVEREQYRKEFEVEQKLDRARLIAVLTSVIAGIGLTSAILILVAFRSATLSKVKASEIAAEALIVSKGQQLEALVEAVRAQRVLKKNILLRLWKPNASLFQKVEGTLRNAIYQNQEINRLQSAYRFWKAQFSPDGSLIATSSEDKKAVIWNVEGQMLFELEHKASVNSTQFSPNGQYIVTASDDKTAKIWNLQGELLAELKDHQQPLISAYFNPFSNLVVTASYDKIARIWTVEGELLAKLKGHQERLYHAQFSPDGQTILTASKDGTARLWNLQGESLAVLEGHQDEVRYAQFSPDGELIVTASRDATARLWNLQGQPVAVLEGHQDQVKRARFSPDGELIVTASRDATARLWNRQGIMLVEFKGHKDWVNDVQFSPDGERIVTASEDNTIGVWNLKGELLSQFVGHEGWVFNAQFSPDGNMIVSSADDGVVRIWKTQGQLIQKFKGHKNTVLNAAFSPDGNSIVTASSDTTARIWNLNGEQVAELSGHQNWVNSAAFSPDGNSIVTGSKDKTAKIWNLKGDVLAELIGHQYRVSSVAFSPDGNSIVTTSSDTTARIWNLKGDVLAELIGHQSSVTDAQFVSNRDLILTASYDKTAYLWNFQGQPLTQFKGHKDRVQSVDSSSDGQFVLTASKDKTVKIWDIQGNILLDLKGHQGWVWNAQFSQDDKLIASASVDKTVRVWTIAGQLLAVLKGHQGAVYSSQFSNDGKTILTASQDKTARLWRTPENYKYPLSVACDRIRGYLKNNPEVDEEDRNLCNGIKSLKDEN